MNELSNIKGYYIVRSLLEKVNVFDSKIYISSILKSQWFVCNVGRASPCTAIPVSVRKLGKRANSEARRTFYSRNDYSKYVCKSMVHHRLLLFISFPFGSTDMGCVSL